MKTITVVSLVCSILFLQCANRTKAKSNDTSNSIRVLTFNILQGGHDATNVGFPDDRFEGSRFDNLKKVIKDVKPDIIGIQEDTNTDSLIAILGKNWNRYYNIYSRFKLKPLNTNGKFLNVCRAYLPNGDSLVFVNCHWWPSGAYGPAVIKKRMMTGTIPDNPEIFEKEILEATKGIANGPRGYNATVAMLKPYLKNKETVILVGDFNEPSHLDWTEDYVKNGVDRWLKNPTSAPLNFKIEWQGSKALEDIGMEDAYSVFHNDEVNKRGITWTPSYKNGTPGR